MLHYLVQPHDEPISWRDVEALPIFGFVLIVLLAVVRMHQELTPTLSVDFLKALGIVMLLGVRKILGDLATDEEPSAA